MTEGEVEVHREVDGDAEEDDTEAQGETGGFAVEEAGQGDSRRRREKGHGKNRQGAEAAQAEQQQKKQYSEH